MANKDIEMLHVDTSCMPDTTQTSGKKLQLYESILHFQFLSTRLNNETPFILSKRKLQQNYRPHGGLH